MIEYKYYTKYNQNITDIAEDVPMYNLHRDNKPALIVIKNGKVHSKKYYQYGLLHRENGPAYIVYTEDKIVDEQYYLNHIPITKSVFYFLKKHQRFEYNYKWSLDFKLIFLFTQRTISRR